MANDLRFTGAPEPPTDRGGPTGRLADWLQNLTLEAVPAEVQARAKHLLLDGIGWGLTASGPVACLLNGTFIQGFELDDFHPLGPLHSASVVLPSLLACAEELGPMTGRVTGAEFLRGAIAGFEVGPRVGMALHGPQMLSRGW